MRVGTLVRINRSILHNQAERDMLTKHGILWVVTDVTVNSGGDIDIDARSLATDHKWHWYESEYSEAPDA